MSSRKGAEKTLRARQAALAAREAGAAVHSSRPPFIVDKKASRSILEVTERRPTHMGQVRAAAGAWARAVELLLSMRVGMVQANYDDPTSDYGGVDDLFDVQRDQEGRAGGRKFFGCWAFQKAGKSLQHLPPSHRIHSTLMDMLMLSLTTTPAMRGIVPRISNSVD